MTLLHNYIFNNINLFLSRIQNIFSRLSRQCYLILCVALLTACTSLPTEYQSPSPLSDSERIELNQKVFDKAWKQVNKRYFDDTFQGLDWGEMRNKYRPGAINAENTNALYTVINTMFSELDTSHLAAINPRAAHNFRNTSAVGTGLAGRLIEEQWIVTNIRPGSAAEKSEVQLGWIITARNDTALLSQENTSYTMKLGQAVNYGFMDEDQVEHKMTIMPELLNFYIYESRNLSDGYVYLRFDDFSRKSVRWLSKQLKTNVDAPGIVLDLRYNGGGSIFSLSRMLAQFLPAFVDVGTFVRRSGSDSSVKGIAWFASRYSGPVTILIGDSSYSSAEIFPYVMQLNERATIIGRTSPGAVVGSRLYKLPDKGLLQIPVFDYLTPDRQHLEDQGVTPDIVVPLPTLTQIRANQDLDVEVALQTFRQLGGE